MKQLGKYLASATMRALASKALVALIMVVLSPLLYGYNREGLEFGFANVKVSRLNEDAYLDFDMCVRTTNNQDRLGTGLVLINYDPAAFGSRIVANGNVIVSKGALLQPGIPELYNIYVADSLPDRLAITFEYALEPGSGSAPGMQFKQLVNVKIRIQQFMVSPGISFHSAAMANQQYLDDNASTFQPITSVTSITEIIPTTPVVSSINVHNSTLTLSWTEVANCYYNVYTSDNPDDNSWVLAAQNLGSNTWTGLQTQAKKFFYITAQSCSNISQMEGDDD